MGEIISFPPRYEPDLEWEIDLLTAVDAAIRDLREISERCDPIARKQADECRQMLERAYFAAAG